MLPSVSGDFVLVRDPELKFNNSGKPWAKLRLVAKDRKRNESGEWVDAEACFIDAVVYGKEAENVTESLEKGAAVLVMGKLLMREWEAEDGRKMTGYSILVDRIGPSLKFSVAKQQRSSQVPGVQAVKDVFAGAVVEDDVPPF